jgi:hypothetical protein
VGQVEFWLHSVLRTDPGRLSWILIFSSRISDPGSNINEKEDGGKNFCLTFFVAINFTKLGFIFIFEQDQKKIRADWQRIHVYFTQKICYQALGKMGWGSEFREPEKIVPDPI